MESDWRGELERWLAPFLMALGHKARARICPAYVAGLIGMGERKSVQPMALRDGSVGSDPLHHFVGAGVWDAAPLERELARQADAQLGGDEAFLIVDERRCRRRACTRSASHRNTRRRWARSPSACPCVRSPTHTRTPVGSGIIAAPARPGPGPTPPRQGRPRPSVAVPSRVRSGSSHLPCGAASPPAVAPPPPARPSPVPARTPARGPQAASAPDDARRTAGWGPRRCAGRPRRPVRRGGLARRRASLVGREEVLPRQSAARHAAEAPRRRGQGALGVRAGAPADEERTRPRPLRGPILAGSPPARAHEHDRLAVPAIPPPRGGKAGKKEPDAGRRRDHRSRACPPFGPR